MEDMLDASYGFPSCSEPQFTDNNQFMDEYGCHINCFMYPDHTLANGSANEFNFLGENNQELDIHTEDVNPVMSCEMFMDNFGGQTDVHLPNNEDTDSCESIVLYNGEEHNCSSNSASISSNP